LATDWITDTSDPRIVCHRVAALVTERFWTNVASRTSLYGQLWFSLSLVVFRVPSFLGHPSSPAPAAAEESRAADSADHARSSGDAAHAEEGVRTTTTHSSR